MAEPSPPPSPQSQKAFDTPQNKPDQTTHSRFFAHLTTYPILSDSFQLLSSRAPGVFKSALTFTNSVSQKFLPNPESSKILSQADTMGDALLTHLDHQFPSLHKETQEIYEEAASRPRKIKERLVDKPLEIAATARNTYAAAIKTHAENFKDSITRIRKEQMEPVIGKYTDPYIGPINDRLAEELDRRLPKSYREALFESPAQDSNVDGSANDDLETKWDKDSENKIELYRTLQLARAAKARIDARWIKPFRDGLHVKIQEIKDYQLRVKDKAAQTVIGIWRGAVSRVGGAVDEVSRIWQEERSKEARDAESMDNNNNNQEKKVGLVGYARAGSRAWMRVLLRAVEKVRGSSKEKTS
ncbi:hypothetical protein RUND412_010706 [Rhizina undulata]